MVWTVCLFSCTSNGESDGILLRGEAVVINYSKYDSRVKSGDWISLDELIFKHTNDPKRYTIDVTRNMIMGKDTIFIPSIMEIVYDPASGVEMLPVRRSGLYVNSFLLKRIIQVINEDGSSVYEYDSDELVKKSNLILKRRDGGVIEIRTNTDYGGFVKATDF